MAVPSKANDRNTVIAAFIVPMANHANQKAIRVLLSKQASPAG